MTMEKISTYAWSWSNIFDHDHGENLNVWWSWSKLYPPLREEAVTHELHTVYRGGSRYLKVPDLKVPFTKTIVKKVPL